MAHNGGLVVHRTVWCKDGCASVAATAPAKGSDRCHDGQYSLTLSYVAFGLKRCGA